MNEITTVGVDLAKEVIVVCGGNAAGRVVMRKQLSIAGFAQWAANLPPCIMGMEACSSAHHWGRTLERMGHTPRLMAAEHVAPFRMSRGAKNDHNDAMAIMVAVRIPTMRFVTVKSVDHQAMHCWHRARSGFIEERKLPELMDEPTHPDLFKPILLHTLDHLRQIEQRVEECDARIAAHAKGNEAAQRVQKISGVGVVTASALIATIGNPKDFRNGRQMAAWAGLVPRQDSSGGKTKLGKITKRGDSYLRGLLTQGARSTLQVALKREPAKRSRLEQWIVALHGRVGYHKTLVAIANKHLRMIWAILAKGEDYDPSAWRRYQQAEALSA